MINAENVLCVRRSHLDRIGTFQGLCFDAKKYLDELLDPAHLTYVERNAAEQNRSFKQLIPYVIIVCGDNVFQYRRGQSGGETRLRGQLSIGVGGHIADTDGGAASGDHGYAAGMAREILEETGIVATAAPIVGLINNDEDDVGTVHLGVVHILRITNENSFLAGCPDIADPKFVPILGATAAVGDYESWSRLCLVGLPQLLAEESKAILSTDAPAA